MNSFQNSVVGKVGGACRSLTVAIAIFIFRSPLLGTDTPLATNLFSSDIVDPKILRDPAEGFVIPSPNILRFAQRYGAVPFSYIFFEDSKRGIVVQLVQTTKEGAFQLLLIDAQNTLDWERPPLRADLMSSAIACRQISDTLAGELYRLMIETLLDVRYGLNAYYETTGGSDFPMQILTAEVKSSGLLVGLSHGLKKESRAATFHELGENLREFILSKDLSPDSEQLLHGQVKKLLRVLDK